MITPSRLRHLMGRYLPAAGLAIGLLWTASAAASQDAGGGLPAAVRLPGPHASAQGEPVALEPVAEIPMGTFGAVVVAGDRAYAGLGPRLAVVNLSGQGAPSVVGFSADLGGAVSGLAVDPRDPGRVLVAAGAAGLVVMDASDPVRPVEAGRLAGTARAVQSDGNRAYVLGQALLVLDAAQPSALREIGRIELPAEAFHVTGDLVWLAVGAAGVMAYDLADPARPAPIGALDTPGSAHDIRVEGGLAYIADGGRRLTILDVAEPSTPRLVAGLTVDMSAARECNPGSDDCGLDARLVRVAGDRVYLVLQRYLGAFSGRTPARVAAVDVSSPAAPRELGQWTTAGNPMAIDAAGGRVLAAVRPLWWYAGIAPCQLVDGGLDVLDLALRHQARLQPPAGGSAVQIYGGRAWVADPVRRLASYEIRPPDPAQPITGTTHGYGSGYGSAEARDLVVDGAHGARFVVGGQTAGFLASANRPAVPSAPLNGCAPPPQDQWYRRIATDGAHDYLLDMAAGLQIFQPGEWRPLGRLAAVNALGLAAKDGRVYLATSDGMTIVDAADPASPTIQGALSLTGHDKAVAIARGADLVVLAGASGLALIDASGPGEPRRLAAIATQGEARAVALTGHTAYAVAGESVHAFDILNPLAPAEIARMSGLREARAVAVDAAHVAVLAAGGLYLFAVLPDDGTPPRLPDGPGDEPHAVYLPALMRGE